MANIVIKVPADQEAMFVEAFLDDRFEGDRETPAGKNERLKYAQKRVVSMVEDVVRSHASAKAREEAIKSLPETTVAFTVE